MGLRIPSSVFVAALVAGHAAAFVPPSIKTSGGVPSTASKSARYVGVDPSNFQDLSHHWQHAADAFGSLTLADAAVDAASATMDSISDVAAASVTAAQPAADAVTDAVTEVAKRDSGWFGFLTEPISGLLQLIHSVLSMGGMSENSWGLSIVALTVLIKLITFPLTKTQLESTNKMQALQPSIKEVQAKYQSNPEVMNQKIAELYQTNNVNPLAGCLPSLVQIPVFIGLYRAVLDLAQENKLDEPFLFLPNLEGPTYGADPAHGSDWLFQGWIDGTPALGWSDTVAFVALPIFLVISQVISMQLMQPKDPAQQQNNAVLKLLPVMIGWFALNVPAALTIYWVVNNIVTTATTVVIRNSMDLSPVSVGAAPPAESPSTIFAPPREKPAGFGGGGGGNTASSSPAAPRVKDDSGVKPITSKVVIDAEIEVPAVPSGEAETVTEATEAAGTGMGSDNAEMQSKKKRGKKRKKKN